jgi:hypothetical protein
MQLLSLRLARAAIRIRRTGHQRLDRLSDPSNQCPILVWSVAHRHQKVILREAHHSSILDGRCRVCDGSIEFLIAERDSFVR